MFVLSDRIGSHKEYKLQRNFSLHWSHRLPTGMSRPSLLSFLPLTFYIELHQIIVSWHNFSWCFLHAKVITAVYLMVTYCEFIYLIFLLLVIENNTLKWCFKGLHIFLPHAASISSCFFFFLSVTLGDINVSCAFQASAHSRGNFKHSWRCLANNTCKCARNMASFFFSSWSGGYSCLRL